MNRWSVRHIDGRWRVYDGDVWWDTFATLPEAHTAATQNAITDTLWAPGGLTLLARWRAAYELVNTDQWQNL